MMKNPEIEVVHFCEADVIATSGYPSSITATNSNGVPQDYQIIGVIGEQFDHPIYEVEGGTLVWADTSGGYQFQPATN